MKPRRSSSALLLCITLIAGCSGTPEAARVAGTVTVGSTPVGPCAVSFYPSDGSRPLATMTEAEGRYEIHLPIGDYKVVVQTSPQLPAGWKEGDTIPPPPVSVPTTYAEPVTTPLSLKVENTSELMHNIMLDAKQR